MLLRLPTFCCILALSVVTARASQEWPQFRGPTGQGVSDATGVPVEWSSTKNVAWKADIPGRGWSSPVLSRGRVYLTTAVEKTKGSTTLHAMCLDEKTGAILWDTEVFKPEASLVGKMHEKNSPASATPIVTEDKLYVHFGTLGTAALDLTGKVLWRQNDLKFSPVHGNGGSPILLNGELVFTCDGRATPLLPRPTPAQATSSGRLPETPRPNETSPSARRWLSKWTARRKRSFPAAGSSAVMTLPTATKSGASNTGKAIRSYPVPFSPMDCCF